MKGQGKAQNIIIIVAILIATIKIATIIIVIKITVEDNTVEPLHNGHLRDRKKCRSEEVLTRVNVWTVCQKHWPW